jgi:hypothetical protein
MKFRSYRSMESRHQVSRRDFFRLGGMGAAVGAGLLLGRPPVWAEGEKETRTPPPRIKTNIDTIVKIPRTKDSLPGLFPGRVVEVHDSKSMADDKPVPAVVQAMFERGMKSLTGKDLKGSFPLFFDPGDVVGIKVNPVGPGLISTRLEVVDSVVAWLKAGGIKPKNIIIWDRFDYMLADAGFTAERYPGLGLEGLQTMDESYDPEKGDSGTWLDKKGRHLSRGNFDDKVFYWADVDGPKDEMYLNQHVVNDKHSYFGTLLTKKLTKIVNVPVFKNTGNGISMATKNLGYGAVCNTGRLHQPLFFDVCTEVLAFPAIRDKLVLNITDGLRGQYDGGPMPDAKFTWEYDRLFMATDPFALDLVCHDLLVAKRKEMKVKVNEHPKYTEYLRYAESMGLGVADPDKIKHLKA